MSIHVELNDLPDIPDGCRIEVELNRVPWARICWHLDARSPMPSAGDLLDQKIEIQHRPLSEEAKTLFSGWVARVRSERLPSFTHRVTVEATSVPAEAARVYGERAAWRVFEPQTSIGKVAEALLMDAGFGNVKVDPALEDRTPEQLVCAGTPAWTFLQRVLACHGAALVVRPHAPGDVSNRFALVKRGKDLAEVGKQTRMTFHNRAPAIDEGYLVSLAVDRGPKVASAVAPWFEVHGEEAWPTPKSSEFVASMPLAGRRSTAAQLGQAVSDRFESDMVRMFAELALPSLSIGDVLEVPDTETLAGDVAESVRERPVVTSTSVRHGTELGEDGEFDVKASLTLIPRNAPVPPPERLPESAETVRVVTGKVVKPPEVQGEMTVALDAPVEEEMRVEWVPHQLSGQKGGLHFPPVVDDRVVVLVESRPYGRVLYLGAHPSQARLDQVRKAFTEEERLSLAENRKEEIDRPIPLKGDHLTRAVVVGSNNVMAWVGPDAGLGEDADEIDTMVWQRLTSSTGQTLSALGPGKAGVDVQGGESFISHHAEAMVAAHAEDTLSLHGERKTEVTAQRSIDAKGKEVTLAAQETIDVQAKQWKSSTQKTTKFDAADVQIAAKQGVSLDGTECTVGAKGKLELSGAQTKLAGSATAAVEGGMVDVKSNGPATIKGAMVNIN
jgi:hypothetical protein